MTLLFIPRIGIGLGYGSLSEAEDVSTIDKSVVSVNGNMGQTADTVLEYRFARQTILC
jgi:hypothetical protein